MQTAAQATSGVAKHTPGIWKAVEWHCHAATTIVSDVNGERIVIAECTGGGRHSDESLGDAKLIATAPRLLIMLEVLVKEFGDVDPIFGRKRVMIQDAQRLIAEARGEA